MNEEEFIIKFNFCENKEQFLKHVYHNLRCLQEENKQLELELSGYRQAILEDKEMLGLQEENRQLKDNWNKLKEFIRQEPTLQFYNDKLPFEIIVVGILCKMQELEKGKSE